jgi:hypothetical protein
VGTQSGDISFAWRLQNGTAEVREAGAYRTETSFATGDTLKITADADGVRYWKNGVVVYAGTSAAGQLLRVQAVLFDLNATLSNITVQTGSTSSATAAAVAPRAARRGGRR